MMIIQLVVVSSERKTYLSRKYNEPAETRSQPLVGIFPKTGAKSPYRTSEVDKCLAGS